jgi:Uma2 family endonuclease
MATAIETELSTLRPIPDEQRILLCDISWENYETLLKVFDERRIRLSYDRGRLEIMTVSLEHEDPKSFLKRIIDMLTFELNMPMRSAGSTTLRRKEVEGGLEPDDSFYIRNEPAIRGKKTIDLEIDPPPDLAIEVEISHNFVDRMRICAALRVPEVWRYNGKRLKVYLLSSEGKYVESERSASFPFLPMREIERFLSLAGSKDETSLMRDFQAWIRQTLLPKSPNGEKS